MWENVLRNFRDPKTFAVGCKLHGGSNTRPDVVSGHSCTGFTRTLIIATANGCIRVSRKKAWNASEWETSDANALVRSMRVIDRCVPQLLYTPLPVNTIVRTPIYCVSCVVSFSGILYSRAHLRKRRFWKRFFFNVFCCNDTSLVFTARLTLWTHNPAVLYRESWTSVLRLVTYVRQVSFKKWTSIFSCLCERLYENACALVLLKYLRNTDVQNFLFLVKWHKLTHAARALTLQFLLPSSTVASYRNR